MCILPLQAEKVTFDTRCSVDFPAGWKKSANAQKGALVYRVSPVGDASFAIARLSLPENAKADLKATLGGMIDGIKKGMKVTNEAKLTAGVIDGIKKGMKVTNEAKLTEGVIDGKQALFVRVLAETEGHKMGFFLVAIDAGTRVFILQATLPSTASEKSRADCMSVIQSFKEDR